MCSISLNYLAVLFKKIFFLCSLIHLNIPWRSKLLNKLGGQSLKCLYDLLAEHLKALFTTHSLTILFKSPKHFF